MNEANTNTFANTTPATAPATDNTSQVQAKVPVTEHTGADDNTGADSKAAYVQEAPAAENAESTPEILNPVKRTEAESAELGHMRVPVTIRTTRPEAKTTGRGGKKQPVYGKDGKKVMVNKRHLQPQGVELALSSLEEHVQQDRILSIIAGMLLIKPYKDAKESDITFEDNRTFTWDALTNYYGEDAVDAALKMIESKFTVTKGTTMVMAASSCALPEADYSAQNGLNVIWKFIVKQQTTAASVKNFTKPQMAAMEKVFLAGFRREPRRQYPKPDVLKNIGAALSSVNTYATTIMQKLQSDLDTGEVDKPEHQMDRDKVKSVLESLSTMQTHIGFVQCLQSSYLNEILAAEKARAAKRRKKVKQAMEETVDTGPELEDLAALFG